MYLQRVKTLAILHFVGAINQRTTILTDGRSDMNSKYMKRHIGFLALNDPHNHIVTVQDQPHLRFQTAQRPGNAGNMAEC